MPFDFSFILLWDPIHTEKKNGEHANVDIIIIWGVQVVADRSDSEYRRRGFPFSSALIVTKTGLIQKLIHTKFHQ